MENLEQIFPHPEAERGKALRMVMVNEGEENRKKNTETDLHQLEENMNNYWHERKCEFILRFVHISS